MSCHRPRACLRTRLRARSGRCLGACAALLVLTAAAGAAAGAAAQTLAVRGGTVYPVSGPPIQDGVVLVRDGRIEAVGPAARVRVPPGYRVLEAAVVTPGLVDVRGTVGLAGMLNQAQDQDALDRGAPLQPALRALDAYNGRDELVAWLLAHGVTTVNTGHAPGALAAGQTVVVKTAYPDADRALVDSTAMLAMTLGGGVRANFASPGTRSRAVADLRRALVDAEDYARRRAHPNPARRPARNLDKDVLAAVVEGRLPALVTAHRAHDIQAVLRLAREFPRMRLVLDGAAEAPLVLDDLVAAGVSVALHPTMARATGELAGLSFETAARLHAAGVPFAIQSGFEAYVPKTRVVLFEAGVALANGLPFAAALEAVTLAPARILGLDRRLGSLEPGKDADLALFDGDPFEYTSRVCAVIVDGRLAHEGCR
ncbi:MAG: amidohydrolase family protein [Rubricoccaceae bacterium]